MTLGTASIAIASSASALPPMSGGATMPMSSRARGARTSAGQRAALSHTGALANEDRIVDTRPRVPTAKLW